MAYPGYHPIISRLGALLLICMASLGVATSSAQAASILQNGDFVGARYQFGPNAGNLVPTPYFFTWGVELTDFAWTNTSYYGPAIIANNGSQALTYAPANPLGYAGNVYLGDAAPTISPGIFLMQTLNGLDVGSTYTLSFLQAGGSYFDNRMGDTAQWIVGLGSGVTYDLIPGDGWKLTPDTVFQSSSLMTLDASGTAPWQRQTLSFTATNATQLLSFMANGTGAPPFALLADVSVTSSVPEPSTWLMMVLGVGLMGMALRSGRRNPALSLA